MRKNNKRALILSCLSLLLCVSMLVGATFAWFTDTASTSVNKIQSGTLDVDLVDKDGNTLVGKTLKFKAAGDNLLWEPGCTWELEDVYVKNNGNLALKYMIEITGIQGSAKLNEVIEWTIDYGYGEGVNEGHLAANAEPARISISGHMKEHAGNEYQNLTIDGIAITVRATQDTVEFDSHNNTYDANAEYDLSAAAPGEGGEGDPDLPFVLDKENSVITVFNASDFALLAEGYEKFGLTINDYPSQYTVKLGKNINYGGGTLSAPITAWWGSLDGQNYTISNVKVTGSAEHLGMFSPGIENKLNVKDLKLDNIAVTNSADGNAMTGVLAGYVAAAEINNVSVTNSTVTGAKYSGGIVGQAGSTHLINCAVSDSTITGTRIGGIVGDAFCEGGSASIKHCSVNNVTLNNTAADGLTGAIAGRLRDEITAENCTSANVMIIAAKNDSMTQDNVQTMLNAGSYVDFNGSTVGTGSGNALYYAKLPGNNATIKNLNMNGSVYGLEMHGDITFENCTFTGTYAPNISDGSNAVPGKVTFKNCTFTGHMSMAENRVTSVEFVSCNFVSGAMNSFQDAIFTNCTFGADFTVDDELAGQQTLSFNGCTMTENNINKTGSYQTVTIVKN